MAVSEVRGKNGFLVGMKGKKIRVSNLMLLGAFAILICIIVFMSFFMRGRSPYISALLPIFQPAAPTYQYSIMGDGENALIKPMGVAVDSDLVYVTDTLNTQVQVFRINGEPVFRFGSPGKNAGQFSFPYGIAIASNGEIYVADTYNGNISIFDKDGIFLRYFAADVEELSQPAAIHIYNSNLFVSNLDPGHILVIDLATEALVTKIGAEGNGDGELMLPNDFTLNPDGDLYVSDTGNNRIQIFTGSGEFVETLAVAEGVIDNPRGIAFNAHGQLLVVNKMFNEIAILDTSGKLVNAFGEDVCNLPNALAVDNSRHVYVTDYVSTLVFQ